MANNKVHLKIITPAREMYNAEADMVIMRSKSGDVGILKGHQPMITVLDYGVMRIKNSGEEDKVLAVFGGFAEVSDDGVLVMSDIAEWPEDIDEARALAAKKRAEDMLASDGNIEGVVDFDVLRAELALKRAIIRLDLIDAMK